MPRALKRLSILVSDAGLALLQKHHFPGSDAVVAAAKVTKYGTKLSGTQQEFNSLAGWTAGEANHCRRERRFAEAERWDAICDDLEAVLGSGLGRSQF